jgi:hypothetical protein
VSVETFKAVPVEQFGGLVTLMDPADVPPGCSPDCQDVEFFPGGWRTRPGLLAPFAAIAGTPKINGVKSYITIALLQRTLVLTSDGKLLKYDQAGAQTTVLTGYKALSYLKSTTAFGYEYVAVHDGIQGTDSPRQFDDALFDRLSQSGPGASPTPADTPNSATFTIDTAVNSGAQRAANVATIKTTAPHGFVTGQTVMIAGVSIATFNGTWPGLTVTGANTFTYPNLGANVGAGAAGGGTAVAYTPGTVVAGVHKVVCFFITKQGYRTRYSPPVTWTAAGGRSAVISNIPIGPSNVVSRGLAFSTAAGTRYWHLASNMLIQDNTTTTVTITFSDVQLASSTDVTGDLTLEVVQPAAGIQEYAKRLFVWGEQPHIQFFRNVDFDGGFLGDLPLGWTAGAANAGGLKNTAEAIFGDCYRIQGDGATATRGEITQGALLDAWVASVPLIQQNRAYTVRARVKKSAGLLAGRLNIDIFGTTGTAIDTAGLQLTQAQVTTEWINYEAELTPAQAALSTDLVLRVFADQTPTNGESFYIEDIRIFPSDTPAQFSTVRASKAYDANSYDGATGLVQVSLNDGQAIRTCFRLRDFLYLVKERSFHVTGDDGVSEPGSWTVTEVSATVGTPSVNGVDVGDQFAAIASPDGLYYFPGAQPEKVSQEIQPTWDRINWQAAGKTVWVNINTKKKRVLIGVPLDAATEPSHILMLDYSSGWADPIANNGEGRKWTIWTIAANSAGTIQSSSGPRTFLGSNNATGLVQELKDGQRTDNGARIPWKYRTWFSTTTGSGGSNLWGYLTAYLFGAGNLLVTAFLPGDSSSEGPWTIPITNPARADVELGLNTIADRVSFQFADDAVAGTWAQVSKMVLYAKPDPWSL